MKKTPSEAILVLGFLGAGKTTLIQELAKVLIAQDRPFSLIVNDSGAVNTDAMRLGEYEPIAINNSCICCSSIDDLEKALIQEKDAGKTIIIEPTGIADGTALSNLLTKHNIQGKTISLTTDREQGDDRSALIQKTQGELAHIIGITHGGNEAIRKKIQQEHPNTPVILIPKPQQTQEIMNVTHTHEPSVFETIINHPIQQFKTRDATTKHGHYPNTSITSSDANIAFTTQGLNEIIKTLGTNLQRAKGIIGGRNFNVIGIRGFIEIIRGENSDTGDYITVIIDKPLDYNSLKQMCIDCMDKSKNTTNQFEDVSSFQQTERNLSQEEIEQQTSILLQQYTEYMDLYNDCENLKKEYETDKNQDLASQISGLQAQLESLGNSMKYNNPFIWLDYKQKAYAHLEDKKVTTIGELRKHCERETYICHKRLHFLNKYLQEVYKIDLYDDSNLSPTTTIQQLLEQYHIKELSQNEGFMKDRLMYEYHSVNGGTNKRENYSK